VTAFVGKLKPEICFLLWRLTSNFSLKIRYVD